MSVRDTSFIPRFAGTFIMWENAAADTSMWLFNGAKWVKLLKTGDVADVLASSGLSKNNDTVQLGQSLGEGNSPAALHRNTEIPLNSFNLGIVGDGGLGVGTNSPTAKFHISDTVSSTSSASSARIETLWNTTGTPIALFMNVTNNASNSSSRIVDIRQDNTSRFYIDRNAGVLNLRSSGIVVNGAGGAAGGLSFSAATPSANTIIGTNSILFTVSSSPANTVYTYAVPIGLGNPTSGVRELVLMRNGTPENGFNPTSGDAQLNILRIHPRINQSGTANGITRGIFIDSLDLMSAAKFKAIDIAYNKATGYGIFQGGVLTSNFFHGNLLVGDSTNNGVGKLQVTGKITVSSHDIGSDSDSAVVWDRSTHEYKVAKIGGTSASGTYTPSFTIVSGFNSVSSPSDWIYSRTGNVVTFSGLVNVEISAAGEKYFIFDLPIPSDGTLFGTMNAVDDTGSPTQVNGYVVPNSTDGFVTFATTTNTGAYTLTITGQYVTQ